MQDALRKFTEILLLSHGFGRTAKTGNRKKQGKTIAKLLNGPSAEI